MGSREDDHNWPEPDRVGRQELEVKLGKEHISFTVSVKKETLRAAVGRAHAERTGRELQRARPPVVLDTRNGERQHVPCQPCEQTDVVLSFFVCLRIPTPWLMSYVMIQQPIVICPLYCFHAGSLLC